MDGNDRKASAVCLPVASGPPDKDVFDLPNNNLLKKKGRRRRSKAINLGIKPFLS